MVGIVIACVGETLPILERIDIKKDETIHNKRIITGKAYNLDVALIVSGIGKVNAGIATQILIDKYNVDKIINFGMAGGLNDNVDLFGIYQIMRACQYDFDVAEIDSCPIGKLCEFDERYIPLSKDYFGFDYASCGTGDRFNDSVDDFKLLTTDIKSDVRDMELGAIAQTAYHANIPLLAFKSISDKPNNSVGQFAENAERACRILGDAFDKVFSILKDI